MRTSSQQPSAGPNAGPSGSHVAAPAWQVWTFVGALLAAGLGLTIGLVGQFGPRTSNPLPLIALIAIFFAAELLRVEAPQISYGLSLTLSGAAFVIGLINGRPSDVIFAASIAAAVHALTVRRLSILDVVFQAGRTSAATAVGVLLFVSLRPEAPLSAASLWAAILACAEASVISAVAAGILGRLHGRPVPLHDLLRGLLYSAVATVASAAIGSQVVLLAHSSFWLLPAVAVPLLLALLAFRTYTQERRSWMQHEFIQQATAALHHDRNLNEGLATVLGQIRTALRAEFAQAVLFSANGSLSVIAHEDPLKSHRLGETDPAVIQAAWALAERLHGPSLITTTTASRDLLHALDVDHGVAVPMFHDQKLAGIIVVANGGRDVDGFRAEDRSLVGMVAQQIEVAIERGWLEQSLHQLVELERQLAHQAHHDGLTALANRRRFNEKLEELVPTGTKPGAAALLLIDLDGFKSVNDNHGHDAGDQLLTVIGRRLSVLVRTGDLVARIGGDEFALVLAGIDDISTAARRADRVIEAIEQPAQIRDYELAVSASVGIALVDDNTVSPAELLRNADLALYHAKGAGKGRFSLYDPAMRAASEARRQLIVELEAAIANREFEVVYQPIHDIISGQLLGAEALIRWMHPERGLLEPSLFLPVAEQTGLIAPIGELMMEAALKTAAGWVDEMEADQAFTLNVNVSARQLYDPKLVDVVRSELIRAGLTPGRLVIEITESAMIEDIDRTKEIVEQLHQLGVHVALDDFGTGYSSLSHVRVFPLHHLKIDKSFVDSIATSATNGAIVGSIVHLASSLGVIAVAEGIETPEQLAELRRRGCRVGQGYLMSEPLSAAAFEELLRSYRPTSWLLNSPTTSSSEP